jgi:hypothetical protein
MNAIVTKYLVTVEQHIDATHSLSDVVKKFAPTYNAMTQEQQLDVRDALVKLIARKKKVEYKLVEKGSAKGRLTFERTTAALSMLNYYLPAKRIVEKSSTTSNQVDTRAKRADSIIRDESTKRDVDKLVADIYAAWARKQAKKAAK